MCSVPHARAGLGLQLEGKWQSEGEGLGRVGRGGTAGGEGAREVDRLQLVGRYWGESARGGKHQTMHAPGWGKAGTRGSKWLYKQFNIY